MNYSLIYLGLDFYIKVRYLHRRTLPLRGWTQVSEAGLLLSGETHRYIEEGG